MTKFDPEFVAFNIIKEHIDACIDGIIFYPKNEKDAYEIMREECATVLTNKLTEKEITISQAYAVAAELGDILWNAFKDYSSDDVKE